MHLNVYTVFGIRMYYVDRCYILYITYGPILYAIVGDLQWHASLVVHSYGLRPKKISIMSLVVTFCITPLHILHKVVGDCSDFIEALSLTPGDSYSGGVH